MNELAAFPWQQNKSNQFLLFCYQFAKALVKELVDGQFFVFVFVEKKCRIPCMSKVQL
jgi:hypothetical protein